MWRVFSYEVNWQNWCSLVQKNGANSYLTTGEAASYLRIKERKLYELVAEGRVPATKATGKWLFPRAELDRWLRAGLLQPPGLAEADPPPIVGGSHDPLLQWALSESRSGLAILPEGSARGFARVLAGEVVAAAIHFHDPLVPDRDANVARVSTTPGLHDAVLIAFARREQGLVVAPGNPKRLGSIRDVVAPGVRIAGRPEGAGARQLLDLLAAAEGLEPGAVPLALVAPTGADLAQAVRSGHADCGVATRAVARGAGLDFVPLVTERFDLLMRQRDSYRPPLQALLGLLGTPAFRAHAADLAGLDVADAGTVRWAP